MSDRSLSEEFRLIAKQWVEADAAATLLEETKSAFLSQRMLALGEVPVSRAEMAVKGSAEWSGHVESIVQARKAANLLKVKLEWIRMRHSEQMSREATERTERKL